MERRVSSPVPQLTMPGGDARRSTNNAQFPVVHVDCLTFNLGEGIPASSVISGVAVPESARSCPPRGKATTCGQGCRFVLASVIGFGDIEPPHLVLQGCTLQP
jgi:hypothetical protein